MQHEIIMNDHLLNERGGLKQRGYAKNPVLNYNPRRIKLFPFAFLNRLALKEWDYYGIITPGHFFSATVADLGYVGQVSVYLIDFKKKSIIEKALTIPLGGGISLPRSSTVGNIHFHHKDIQLSFIHKDPIRIIKVSWQNFSGEENLKAEIEAYQNPQDHSIVMATPIDRKRFYYNRKINCMPSKGSIKLGEKTIVFNPKQGLATFDWGRGVWKYSTFWNWASASGYTSGGRRFGLNFGKGFGDLSQATENCVFMNGIMTKLGHVDFCYNTDNLIEPWLFSSPDHNVDLEFRPFFVRTAKTNLLIVKSEIHQVFGHYSGTVLTRHGEKIHIEKVTGWVEEHRAKW